MQISTKRVRNRYSAFWRLELSRTGQNANWHNSVILWLTRFCDINQVELCRVRQRLLRNAHLLPPVAWALSPTFSAFQITGLLGQLDSKVSQRIVCVSDDEITASIPLAAKYKKTAAFLSRSQQKQLPRMVQLLSCHSKAGTFTLPAIARSTSLRERHQIKFSLSPCDALCPCHKQKF